MNMSTLLGSNELGLILQYYHLDYYSFRILIYGSDCGQVLLQDLHTVQWSVANHMGIVSLG